MENTENLKNIALLIDADNITPAAIDPVLTVMAELGQVNIRRAYGNFAKQGLAKWDTITNRYGIPEPDVTPAGALRAEDMAVLVMPLVGFDADCHRLGMGGGWYDRSLAFRHDRPAPPWLVGAAFAAQRVDALPREAWDVRLDAVCCEDDTLLAHPAG